MTHFPLHHVARPALDRAAGVKPPLLVLLHGYGSNEDDLFALAPYLDERCVIVSARGPITLSPGAYAWFRIAFVGGWSEAAGEGAPFSVDAAAADESCRLLIQFVEDAARAYDADRQRVFLLGFSQGASMALLALLRAPDAVAGVAAMSGFLLPIEDLSPAQRAALAGKPVILTHGTDDDIVPIALGRQARDALSALPVALTWREYPMQHQITDESLNDVSQWLSELTIGD
ncbi:MAG: alpha/beta hydrolase [Candidatus Roseilinea sp.]|uniref:alpha/beta hydrolase n=1 Tax=Candidatus Roseilinea sp. TaxID=2838777 RepID=UPI00404A373E